MADTRKSGSPGTHFVTWMALLLLLLLVLIFTIQRHGATVPNPGTPASRPVRP